MSTVVSTSRGRLRGSSAGQAHTFLGIPYAAPPAGRGRLRPPQPAAPWSGVRDATRYGPAPPQVAPPPGAGIGWDSGVTGEDCLSLSVWTPDPGAAGLPVMVWIQGGQFEFGSTASYDGSEFARDGVVFVVINWRVGADGFLCLADGTANVGLLDQVAALAWVREEIAAFGGDPGNVTVCGESAGAMSIGALLAMPRAEGLFRRAVLQSGAAHQVMSAASAERIGRELAGKLGAAPTREAIAAAGTERLLKAQAELKADLLAHPDPERWGGEAVATAMPWQPVIDGDVIPAPPIERIAAGASAGTDIIAGTNTDDWRIFRVLGGEIDQTTEEMLTGATAVYGYQALSAYGLAPAPALAAYHARYPGLSPGELLAAVQTDWWVRVPAIRLADAHTSDRARTYMYEFAWATPAFGGRLGAVHALEIPFVFGILNPDTPLFGPLLGDDPPQDLADRMHAAWVSFAASGDPGWPEYRLPGRATRRFGATPEVVADPRAWERDLWEGIR